MAQSNHQFEKITKKEKAPKLEKSKAVKFERKSARKGKNFGRYS